MPCNVLLLYVARRFSGTDIVYNTPAIISNLKNNRLKYIAMAEREGTSFENPAYDPYGLGEDDDDEGKDANERTPFIPGESSTPHGKEQEIPMQTMQHEKSGLPATSYAEASFTGAQTLSEQAWVATKDIYPDMSSSELEVSYSSKGKLQVKMFGAGKKRMTCLPKTTGEREKIRSIQTFQKK